MTLVQCHSLWEGIGNVVAEEMMPPILISLETAMLTDISIAYKDSTGRWPRDREALNLFYKKEVEKFLQDSVFQFNNSNFKYLKFSDLNDTLEISFSTILIPDSAYNSIFSEEFKKTKVSAFYKYAGLVKLYSDSTEESNYMRSVQFDSMMLYDANKKEFHKYLQ